jgi:hypothetical protein
MRVPSVLLLLVATLAACGNKDSASGAADSKVASDLATCTQDRDKAKNALSSCQKDFDVLKNSSANGGGSDDKDAGPGEEWIVRVDGDLLTISGHTKNGVAMPTAPAELSEDELKAAESVTAMMRGSKNSIQACYITALKSNVDLANRTISLEVKVVVNPNGKVTNASFSPAINPQFDGCMRTVANRWAVTKFNGKPFPIAVTIKLENK